MNDITNREHRTGYIAVRLTDREKDVFRKVAEIEERNLSDTFRLWLRLAAEQYGVWQPAITVNGGRDQ